MAVSDVPPEFSLDRDEAPVSRWYDSEVPGIVAGLESSGFITRRTADRARQLIERGSADQALALVLDEADS